MLHKIITGIFIVRPSPSFVLISNLDHLAQVNDKAVSFVEAGPGHGHLCGPDGPTALNVQQALDVHVIGHHVLEARGYPSLLRGGQW